MISPHFVRLLSRASLERSFRYSDILDFFEKLLRNWVTDADLIVISIFKLSGSRREIQLKMSVNEKTRSIRSLLIRDEFEFKAGHPHPKISNRISQSSSKRDRPFPRVFSLPLARFYLSKTPEHPGEFSRV